VLFCGEGVLVALCLGECGLLACFLGESILEALYLGEVELRGRCGGLAATAVRSCELGHISFEQGHDRGD
jgi:hypothetical protein